MIYSAMSFKHLALLALVASFDASVSAFIPNGARGLGAPSTSLNVIGQQQGIGQQGMGTRTSDPYSGGYAPDGRNNIVSTGGQLGTNPATAGASDDGYDNFWDYLSPVTVQGGTLKTWSFQDPTMERVQIYLKTDGRPMNAIIELWNGPDNTPQKVGVYIEDGSKRSFRCVIETPKQQNSIAIRNVGALEFPMEAAVEQDVEDIQQRLFANSVPEVIQGGSLKTYSLDHTIQSAVVVLKTEGRPLNARVELLQGPNTNKQVLELYTEDGIDRPFCAIVDTPGVGNVFRVVNTSPVEFPLTAYVAPWRMEPGSQQVAAPRANGRSMFDV